eukprot:3471771-Alexandrium_andersonii.AAC.1
MNAAMDVYRSVPGSETIPYFVTVNGKQVRHICRHPCNDRDQEDVRQTYKEQIKQDGVAEMCRSEIIGLLLSDQEVQAATELHARVKAGEDIAG